MIITTEGDLKEFEFWGGAKTTASYLTDEEFRKIQSFLEDSWPNGINATTLNDLFAFEKDFIAVIIGYENFDQIMEERK